jgi:hypothetical protein
MIFVIPAVSCAAAPTSAHSMMRSSHSRALLVPIRNVLALTRHAGDDC